MTEYHTVVKPIVVLATSAKRNQGVRERTMYYLSTTARKFAIHVIGAVTDTIIRKLPFFSSRQLPRHAMLTPPPLPGLCLLLLFTFLLVFAIQCHLLINKVTRWKLNEVCAAIPSSAFRLPHGTRSNCETRSAFEAHRTKESITWPLATAQMLKFVGVDLWFDGSFIRGRISNGQDRSRSQNTLVGEIRWTLHNFVKRSKIGRM